MRNLPLFAMMAAATILNRLVNVLASDATVWRLHDVTQSASLAFAVSLALSFIPYSNLRLKCCAAVLAGAVWADLLFTLFFRGVYLEALLVQTVAGLGLGTWFWLRAYSRPSDPITPGHLHCVRARPQSAQGLALCLAGCFGPWGGYALYCDGTLYHYSKGVLRASPVSPAALTQHHVARGGPISAALTEALRDKIGTPWTWRKNCLTVLGAIWRRHRD